MIDILFVATEDFNLESILDNKEFYDSYVFEDINGFLSVSTLVLEYDNEIKILIKYLFNTEQLPPAIYDSDGILIYDISNMKHLIVNFSDLEDFYGNWIIETGRENNMDEYGFLLDSISYISRNNGKEHLLMIIDKKKNYV